MWLSPYPEGQDDLAISALLSSKHLSLAANYCWHELGRNMASTRQPVCVGTRTGHRTRPACLDRVAAPAVWSMVNHSTVIHLRMAAKQDTNSH